MPGWAEIFKKIKKSKYLQKAEKPKIWQKIYSLARVERVGASFNAKSGFFSLGNQAGWPLSKKAVVG